MKYNSWQEKGMGSKSFFTIGLETFEAETCLESITALYCTDLDSFHKIEKKAFQLVNKLRLFNVVKDREDKLSNKIEQETLLYIETLRKELKDYGRN